jgi:hypothetical protein
MIVRSALFSTALAALALAGCTKPADKTAEAPAAPVAPATPAPAPDATPAAPAGVDAAARNYPKVDPATLTDASTVADVHNALIRPGYDRLTDAENTAPTTDDGWKTASDGADMVIKGAGLLTKGSRPKDQGEWVKFANAVAEKTKVTAANLAKKDSDDLVFSDGDIQDACTSCHQKYRQ